MAVEKKLIIFCWGDGNCDAQRIKELKEFGLHGIIFDRMDAYNTKENKASIFQVDTQLSDNCILTMDTSSPDDWIRPYRYIKTSPDRVKNYGGTKIPTA